MKQKDEKGSIDRRDEFQRRNGEVVDKCEGQEGKDFLSEALKLAFFAQECAVEVDSNLVCDPFF